MLYTTEFGTNADDHQSVCGRVILLSVPRNPTDHIQGEMSPIDARSRNQTILAISLITEHIFLQAISFYVQE
jgi:hypothetical protein